MQALPVRTRLTMPMVIALFVLVSGFVAIAWTVQWATAGSGGRIEQVTTAGAATISAPVANDVAGSLPAFTLDLDGAIAYQPQAVNGWLNPDELDTMTEGVSTFVWLTSWWNCAFITNDYAYLPVGVPSSDQARGQDAIDIARWNELTFRQQQNIKEACK